MKIIIAILFFIVITVIVSCKFSGDKKNESKKEKTLGHSMDPVYSLDAPVSKDSTILKILKSIKAQDASEIESLRDDMKPSMKREIAQYWSPDLPEWTKSSFVHIYMDQKIKGIEFILEEALSNSDIDTRVSALCILLQEECEFDDYYNENGGFHRGNFKKGVARYQEIKKNGKSKPDPNPSPYPDR